MIMNQCKNTRIYITWHIGVMEIEKVTNTFYKEHYNWSYGRRCWGKRKPQCWACSAFY